MSSNNTRSGMVTQIFTSAPPAHYSNNFTNIANYAVGTKVLPFLTDGNSHTHILELSPDIDCYIPHTFVIHLYSNPNIQDPEYIQNMCNLFHTMRLVLKISEQTVLQLPLSLLCKIKPPEIHDEKLYIHIPFKSLFEKINMIELLYSTVTFSLMGSHEISNYANNFSLITKIYMYDSHERRLSSNNNINRSIQQISTLYISNHNPSNENLLSRRIFQIQTNMLNGVTKGLLIQCSLANLISIKFYLNNLLRFDYDPYLISTACIKLSNNLLYMPFNDETDFLNRDIDSFYGSINLSRLQNSILFLQFDQDQDHVVIHNVYLNYLRQNSGLSGLGIDYRPTFTENTINDHPIQPIVGIPPNSNMLDMSGNYIINSSNMRDMSGNYIINNPSSGRTGPNYHNTGSSATTGTSGDTGPPSSIQIHYPIPNGAIIYQPINPERNICNITHDEIAVNQRYMSCSNCQIHFLETALKRWFSPRIPSTRTCPTCREVWTNFNVYVNSTTN